MIRQSLFVKCILTSKNIHLVRYLRKLASPRTGPKRIDCKVETLTQYEEENFTPSFESYKDFIRHIEKSQEGDELEVEKHFLDGDYHGDAFERCDKLHDIHESEEKRLKSYIKKKIIGHKYFKLDKETNLLTHAAKEQIRFLHESDPLEWNPQTLSECFPISEAGVKKLLRCNFVQTCPEKIKLHDENVARKWKLLKSGKPTNEIFPLTQKLYKEGKLVDDYFSGNPDLPTKPPPNKKIIEIKKKEELGEFSAIVKTYLEYQNQKLIESGKISSNETQISLRDPATRKKYKTDLINMKKFKNIDEDDDNVLPQVYPTQIERKVKDDTIPLSQFKEILKEEANSKFKSKHKEEYDDFVIKEISKKYENTSLKIPHDSAECFVKIPKYKTDNIELMYEKKGNASTVYKYDEEVGYQYSVGKTMKGRINISPKQRNKKLYKVGQNIFDNNGEFLYRIP